MTNEFNWQIEDTQEVRHSGRDPFHWSNWWWVVLALALVAAVALWHNVRQQLAAEQAALQIYVQRRLDLQHQAFVAGDGDLFFDSVQNNPALRAAQLWPLNQEAWRAGYTATQVEQLGESIAVVSAQWTAAGQTYQRLLFYEQTPNGLRQRPSPTAFWGQPQTIPTAWGKLVLYEVDEAWTAEFDRQISNAADFLCGRACPPLDVIVAPDWADTAAPQTILIPSPRLIALDETGQPSPLYWQTLLAQLKAYYAPDPIRFAVPAAQTRAYEELATRFAQYYLAPTIEIIALESLPADPAAWVPMVVDGAAVAPTESLLAAGMVRDLTDYVNSDESFNQGDFYEQIWLAGWWHGRMWFIPHTAEMSVIYYDPFAYRQLGRAEPSLRWTWAEMQADAAAFATGPYGWGVADAGRDLLFSYAYNAGNSCATAVTVRCNGRLSAADITAALTFYQQMAPQMPELSALSPTERENQLLTLTSPSSNGVSLWVSKPVEYENHFQQRTAGVLPFPSSDLFDGVTPLWVQGSFISAASAQPRQVWAWLRFLSYQYPTRTGRLIPARPSVAQGVGYWHTLPQPLDNALRTAFPFARPVLIEEQNVFLPAQLEAVRTNKNTPAEAVRLRPRVVWFGVGE